VEDDDIDSINVVPLVDVMLVLLTIVLTTATFVVNGRIPVDLARSSSAQVSQQAPVVLTVTVDEELFVNDQRIGDLDQALAHHPRDADVIVRADGRLPLARFVYWVDRVKAQGFGRVSLEVQRT
jgi:biopolymer transport protein ExbD